MRFFFFFISVAFHQLVHLHPLSGPGGYSPPACTRRSEDLAADTDHKSLSCQLNRILQQTQQLYMFMPIFYTVSRKEKSVFCSYIKLQAHPHVEKQTEVTTVSCVWLRLAATRCERCKWSFIETDLRKCSLHYCVV